MEQKRLNVTGGVCGILGVAIYLTIALAPQLVEPTTQTARSLAFLLSTTWPIFSIVFSYALYCLIAQEQQGLANRIAFILSLLAFATVTVMLSVQLTVQSGIAEYQDAATHSTDFLATLLPMMRLIDLGMDLAWDIFMGTSLLIGAIPMFRHSRLGPWFAWPSCILGFLLIILNAQTFPWPPDSRGLFDIGPLIGMYSFFLAVWILRLGLKTRLQNTETNNREKLIFD